jgi:cellulose synthase/poly-beta-1,6-N-acetylglucosamine synthase-like glycosyltransferase
VSVHVPGLQRAAGHADRDARRARRARLPDFEVIVIDNNTKDESCGGRSRRTARSSARASASSTSTRCGLQGRRAQLRAARRPTPAAEIVAVIDSDYVVRPAWLRDLVPQFADPRIGIVQAPQDYRDARENAFKAMCYAEYRGFFHIGMVTRNERNAIIQHGTMTMVRRDAAERSAAGPSGASPRTPNSACASSNRGYEATYIPRATAAA